MPLNNVDKIKTFLSFNNPGDFYFVQLIKRRKDNPEMSKDVKVIKSHYLNSLDDYDKLIPKIIETCDRENCRAYIRLNVRNYNKLGLKLISEVAQMVSNGNDLKSLPNVFDSVAGQYSSDLDKKWIVDIDWVDLPVNQKFYLDGTVVMGKSEMSKFITTLQGLQLDAGKVPLIEFIRTKNGFHVITRPFNLQIFSNQYPKFKVQKDNMTLIYIP
jgi:hypothetical protein